MGLLRDIFKSLWGSDEPGETEKPTEVGTPSLQPVENLEEATAVTTVTSLPEAEVSLPSPPTPIPPFPPPEPIAPSEALVEDDYTPEIEPMEQLIETEEEIEELQNIVETLEDNQKTSDNIPLEPVLSAEIDESEEIEEVVEKEENILVESEEIAITPAIIEPIAEITVAPSISTSAIPTNNTAVSSTLPEENNFFKDVVDDFDEAFDAAFRPTTANAVLDQPNNDNKAGLIQHDEAAIQDLFANIAANYARPVKNFVFELKRGTATKEWIEICRPAMRSISRAAENMELSLAAKRMGDFDEALSLAQTSDERVLGGEIRDLILASYDDLIEVLPQTFLIGEEEQQREGTIINSLLKQVPDLGRVTVEKLYGAGLTSLDALFLAKKEDLGAATGIPIWLCERICNKFQQYREELEGTPRDVAQSGYRMRLSELIADLRLQHEGFERTSAQEWSNPAFAQEKRKFRQHRQACVLQINVVLAEMGELDLVNEIQKLSFERRIQRLEEYLINSPGMM